MTAKIDKSVAVVLEAVEGLRREVAEIRELLGERMASTDKRFHESLPILGSGGGAGGGAGSRGKGDAVGGWAGRRGCGNGRSCPGAFQRGGTKRDLFFAGD